MWINMWNPHTHDMDNSDNADNEDNHRPNPSLSHAFSNGIKQGFISPDRIFPRNPRYYYDDC